MPTLLLDGPDLVVHLSAWEQFAAFRGDVRVPLSTVRSVAIEPDPWKALRGIRAPGTGFPGVIAYGPRRLTGERNDFAAILRKRSTIRIELDPPAQFARLLISTPDAEGMVQVIRDAAGLPTA